MVKSDRTVSDAVNVVNLFCKTLLNSEIRYFPRHFSYTTSINARLAEPILKTTLTFNCIRAKASTENGRRFRFRFRVRSEIRLRYCDDNFQTRRTRGPRVEDQKRAGTEGIDLFVFGFYTFRNYSAHTRRRCFTFMTELFATTRFTLIDIISKALAESYCCIYYAYTRVYVRI